MPAPSGLRGKPCHARAVPRQRVMDSSVANSDGITAVASCASIERRRTVWPNQGSKVDGSKARRPCTDMLSAIRQQRAGSGARARRQERRVRTVFGRKTKTDRVKR